MRRYCWPIVIILFCSVAIGYGQDVKTAVVQIQVFDHDSTLLRSGTGFFQGSQPLLTTYEGLFTNAAYALAITTDSTVHQLLQVEKSLPETGVVMFSVDNTLSTKLSRLAATSAPLSYKENLTFIYAEKTGVNGTVKATVEATDTIPGFGLVSRTRLKAAEHLYGAPALTDENKWIGVAVPADKTGSSLFIADVGHFQNSTSESVPLREWLKM